MLGAASQESVTTLKNPNNSGSSTVQTTPRKAGEEEDGGERDGNVIKNSDGVSTPPSKDLTTDINANPHLAQSTPHMEKANAARDIDSVSPVVSPDQKLLLFSRLPEERL